MAQHPQGRPSGGILSKAKLFILFSLALTWWMASLLPHYQPIIRAQLTTRLEEARQKIPSIKVDWTPTDDPRAAYNASKLAMIIEPRVLPHLVPQLLHMIAVVPPDWRFLFIGSPESVTMLGRSSPVRHQQVVGKLDLMVLPEPWDIGSKEMVYRTLTDMRFYDEFLPGVEWILKYEYDSILCANSESSLNEWLHWHWAGAPRTVDDHFSGNGGLSLRRVSAIRKILSFQARYNDSAPEDEWFGQRLYITPGLKVASGLEGALAVESVYKERPMGFHVQEMGENLPQEVWGSYERRKEILDYCPELYTVLNAKLDRERCPGDTKDGVIHPTPEEATLERIRLEAEAEARNKAMQEAAKKIEEANRQKQEEDRKQMLEAAAAHAAEEAKAAAEEQGAPTVTGKTPAWATARPDQSTAEAVPLYGTQVETPAVVTLHQAEDTDSSEDNDADDSAGTSEDSSESQESSWRTSQDEEPAEGSQGGGVTVTDEDQDEADSSLTNPDGGI